MSLLSRLFGRKEQVVSLDLTPKSQIQVDPASVNQEPTVTITKEGPLKGGVLQSTVTLDGASPSSLGDALFHQGQLIKGCFLVERILAGGMGTVYICRKTRERAEEFGVSLPAEIDFGLTSPRTPDDDSRRYQAIKSFRREFLFHGDVRKRFEHEALLWLSLPPHPNIVRAFTFERAAPLLFLEYVDGGDLRSRLGQPLDPREIARIALQFCNGMAFLFESAGIIHGDIKPANILLTRGGTVRITDFGLAKAFFSPLPGPTDSRSDGAPFDDGFVSERGRIIGSLPWMSPEQLTDPRAVTVASDVYSFGVVLYEMLTGRMPFQALGSKEWGKKILHETPTPPAYAGADEKASAITMRCMEKRPERRFGDFVELRRAIEDWVRTMGWCDVIPAAMTTAELETSMTPFDWVGRGYAFGQLGRDDDSYRCYLRVLDLDPTHLGIHTNVGSALLRLGRVEEGIRHYEQETSTHPTFALGWDTLAAGYLLSERLGDAQQATRKAFELAPNNPGIVRRFALTSRRAGVEPDYQRAIAAVKALLDQPPNDDPRTATTEAILFLQDGDVQTGFELHTRSVTKYPRVAITWYNFAVTLHRHGRALVNNPGTSAALLDKAIGYYSTAIQLDKASTLALIYRGAIRAHRGENELARSDWQTAIATDPNHAASQMVQILLQLNFAPQLREWLDKLDSRAALQYVL
jgi:serine/threonine protein kinase